MPLQISYRPISSSPNPTYNLIFFITGNPGLIDYYAPFLSTLHTHLSSSPSPSSPSSPTYHIHGPSLAGFETLSDLAANPSLPQKLYSLAEEIEYVKKALIERIHDILDGSTGYENVGSYILLETLTHLLRTPSLLTPTPPHLSGILLFPTITHISSSPSGLTLSPLLRLPQFPLLSSSLAKGLLSLSPNSVLNFLIPKVTGMSTPAANVTRDFLRSRQGVQQALYLAQDEMETIKEDRWRDEIWGVENANTETEVKTDGEEIATSGNKEEKITPPRLLFYFGRNDHWVAEHTRDALIAARGRNGVAVDPEHVSFLGEGGNKPIMMIDEEGIDHSFCVHSSEPMAEKNRCKDN
ncbi:major facilitator superfamily transporter protein [Rutstroemia sp. NJR-2017a BBW]|nr:major facilitator superfamily transporter protein [Rutstroemia sp. NJR-2017a BBW]